MSSFFRYIIAVFVVLVAALVGIALEPLFGDQIPLPLFALAVIASAGIGGIGPGLVTTALSLFAINLVFADPQGQVDIRRTHDIIQLGLSGITGVLISLAFEALHRSRRKLDAHASNLAESQQKLSNILESISDCFYAIDHDWKYTAVNRQAEIYLGKSREEMLGRVVWDVFPQKLGTSLEQQLRKAMSERVSVEFEMPGIVDPSRWVWGHAYPSSDGITVFWLDVTERKQAEDALKESERRFRGVVESEMVGILFWHIDGRIIDANETFLQLIGYSRADLEEERLRWTDLTPPEYSPLDEKMVTQLRRKGRMPPYEKEYIRKDGSRVPILVGSSFIPGREDLGVAFVVDITERKKREAELHRREEEFRALAENSPDIIIRFDKELHLIYANSSLEEFCNISISDWIGKPFLELKLPEDAKTLWKQSSQQVFETGREQTFEFYLPFPQETKYFQVRLVPEFSRNDYVQSLLAVGRDITVYRRMEDTLRENQEHLELALETARMGTWEIDIKTGDLEASDLAKALFGLPPEHVPSMEYFYSLVHPDDRPALQKNIEETMANCSRYDADYRIIWPDGSIHWIIARGQCYTGLNGRPERLVGIVLDISERKLVQEALRESEERFRSIFTQAAVGIADLTTSGQFKMVNQKVCELTGYSSEELLQTNFRDITHPDDLAADEAQAQKLVAGEIDSYAMEKRYIRKDGRIVWIDLTCSSVRDEAGRSMYAIAVIEDITQRKRAEEALRESEKRFRLILESALDYAIFTLDLDGRVTSWNTGAEQVLGYGESEILGQSGNLIFTAEDRQQHRLHQEIQKALSEGRAENECWHVRKDGNFFWGNGLMMPLRDPEGQVLGFLNILRDETQRKQAEDQRQSINQILEQRVAERTAVAEQRAEQLQQLTSELAQAEQRERRRLAKTLHDHLQQLLVAAKLNVGTLETKVAEEEVQNSLHQVSSLLDESIEASRSLTVELSPPVLYDAGLAAALDWLGRWIQEKHNLTVDVEADPKDDPQTEEIRVLLFEAVRELLFNVVKHAGVDRAGVAMTALEDDQVQIIVSDEGAGFDLSEVQTKADTSKGFGLFSIFQRLELIGGRMDVQTAPGKGTRTVLKAPLRRAETKEKIPEAPEKEIKREVPAPKTPRARGVPEAVSENIRVIIADDHKILREGLANLLAEQSDIEVVGEVADGQTAVELTRELRPDVVVMDVSMPRMNGVEATRRINSQLPDVQIIGLSLHEEEDLAHAMREAGATTYLTKGGPFENLVSAIRSQHKKVKV